MKGDRKMLRISTEVFVRTEDRGLNAFCNRTDEEIYMRSLHSHPPTAVGELRRAFIVELVDTQVVERPEPVPQGVELPDIGDSREQFLPDRPKEERAAFLNQLGELFHHLRVPAGGGARPPECKRPDGGVDKHVHFLCLSAL